MSKYRLALADRCPRVPGASTANFNVSTTTLPQLGCDTICQTYFKAGLAADVEMFGTSFDSDFYSTASNFTGSAAGDLLKFEFPGTIGVFAGCPPTTTTDLYDYHSWSLLIEDGYAVVVPDYAGLGNNATLHKYLSFPAHANDLYYAMVAACKALPHTFTSECMSVGHSQGGGAVWKLSKSELVKTHGAGEYLGTVALAPARRIYDMTVLTAETILTGSSYASYDRVIPGIDLSFFSATFLQRVQIAELAQACYYSIMSLGYSLTPPEIITNTSALVNNAPFQAWQNATAPANGGTAETPMLIVQGLNDTAVLPEITVRSFNASCLSGNKVHMSLYADMDHTDVLTASSPEWLGFIRDRFARETTSGRCSAIQRTPFDRAHLVTEVELSEVTKSVPAQTREVSGTYAHPAKIGFKFDIEDPLLPLEAYDCYPS
ncbi:hypothetical protein BO99DRAFT_458779 [Aspergillus violaceofuscus CBS 115571]|uniref:Alpha/beta-hydrolase n=1 Tax=Aspergillus violaceofuscus (strain CBS 115571) TaxID=1450538 RepID=A0A2V5HCQ1_ASPV1|nr:hypothetical protein BO99DRAFT_458779 [Aspergillus violaceofuscus CBS 115571]